MLAIAHAHPELTVLAINVLVLALAYTVLYPPLAQQPQRLALLAVPVDGAALMLAAGFFWGHGISFALFGLTLNWFWFALLTLVLIELPLYVAFGLRHGWPSGGFGSPKS